MALYPASNDPAQLGEELLALKIARHSSCSSCDCPNLHPSESVDISTDAQSGILGLAQYGSDEDEDPPQYLTECECGHGVSEHGNSPDISEEGQARRGRVAIRLDEILQRNDRLLDFSYVDDDILSLRKQLDPQPNELMSHTTVSSPSTSMTTSNLGLLDPSAVSSPVPIPEIHSSSSLSDEDEDRPLASRVPSTILNGAPGPSNHRTGKTVPGHMKTASTAPAPIASSPTNSDPASPSGVPLIIPAKTSRLENGVSRKEEKAPQGQISRIATTFPADTSSPRSPQPEKPSVAELRRGIIRIDAVSPDGNPRSLIILTGLKNLFQKQLPKMPREYIARLVYDQNSRALAIVKRGWKVVGGILFRPFPHRNFAEIVFFATASVDQVKGYGGMLMNHFKAHIKKTYPGMLHFLTYADNYAVGYFKKQGFTKEITLDRSVWAGYIKDYEGGTIMQCTMLRKVDYLQTKEILTAQREAILSKIRQKSRARTVYEPLPQFLEAPPGEAMRIDPQDVPGLRETGWTFDMAQAAPPSIINPHHSKMQQLLTDLQNHPQAWAFLTPVNGEDVVDYYDVIKKPMDFQTMEHKLSHNMYSSIEAFVADAELVFDNCLLYNPEGSVYAKNAIKLKKYLQDQLAELAKSFQ